jgi:hypothetical protein
MSTRPFLPARLKDAPARPTRLDLACLHKVASVPGDQEWADNVVWRNLTESRATILVSDEIEWLLAPLPRSLIHRPRADFLPRLPGAAPPQ